MARRPGRTCSTSRIRSAGCRWCSAPCSGAPPRHDFAGGLTVLLHLAGRGGSQDPPVPPLHAGPVRHRVAAARAPHRPQPRGAPPHGRHISGRAGRAVPAHGARICTACCCSRSPSSSWCAEALRRHQGCAGARDGRARPARSREARAGRLRHAQRAAHAPRHAGRLRRVRARRHPLQAGRLSGGARLGHDRLRRLPPWRAPGSRCSRAARPRSCGPTRPTKVREYGQAGDALDREQDLLRLQPMANPEVMLGLTAMCIVRGLHGLHDLHARLRAAAHARGRAVLVRTRAGRQRRRSDRRPRAGGAVAQAVDRAATPALLPLAHRHLGRRLCRLGHACSRRWCWPSWSVCAVRWPSRPSTP